MAYLNTNLLLDELHTEISPSGEVLAWPSELDPLERQVVALSIDDPVRSLRKASTMWRILGLAFGFRTVNPLADQKLEALRRFAILSRKRRDALPAEEAELLIEAGYSHDQLMNVRRLLRIEAMLKL